MKEIEEFFFFYFNNFISICIFFLYVPFEKYTNMNIRFRFVFF